MINDTTHTKRQNSWAITNHKSGRAVMEAVVASFVVLPRGRSETRNKTCRDHSNHANSTIFSLQNLSEEFHLSYQLMHHVL